MDLLGPDEIDRIEREYASGVTARVVVTLFEARNVRLSEATFRKYVQAGLLPRSRRVGRKGKHRGSTGLYPVEVIRRINVIKKMMDEGMTLEDIRRSFVFFRNHIDQVERTLGEVLNGFEAQLGDRPFAREKKKELEGELLVLRQRGEEFVRDVARLGSAVTAGPKHHHDLPNNPGA
ncbi:MAG: MerR family transcriptional regulator [Myxococcaceae bacterium]